VLLSLKLTLSVDNDDDRKGFFHARNLLRREQARREKRALLSQVIEAVSPSESKESRRWSKARRDKVAKDLKTSGSEPQSDPKMEEAQAIKAVAAHSKNETETLFQ
jgi:hypothetical protein